MDWKALGKKITSVGAGLLGTAIAGPAGGAAMGAIVGEALGIEGEATPDNIAQAIDRDPAAAVKLQQLQSEERTELRRIAASVSIAEIEAEAAQTAAVNETMRAELQAPLDYRSAWRPTLGFVLSLGIGGILLAFTVLLFRVVGLIQDGHAEAVPAMTQGAAQIASAIMPIIVVGLGVLGYQVGQRTREKVVKMGGAVSDGPTLAGAIAERIAGRSKP